VRVELQWPNQPLIPLTAQQGGALWRLWCNLPEYSVEWLDKFSNFVHNYQDLSIWYVALSKSQNMIILFWGWASPICDLFWLAVEILLKYSKRYLHASELDNCSIAQPTFILMTLWILAWPVIFFVKSWFMIIHNNQSGNGRLRSRYWRHESWPLKIYAPQSITMAGYLTMYRVHENWNS
jgi:hypothetical protein